MDHSSGYKGRRYQTDEGVMLSEEQLISAISNGRDVRDPAGHPYVIISNDQWRWVATLRLEANNRVERWFALVARLGVPGDHIEDSVGDVLERIHRDKLGPFACLWLVLSVTFSLLRLRVTLERDEHHRLVK